MRSRHLQIGDDDIGGGRPADLDPERPDNVPQLDIVTDCQLKAMQPIASNQDRSAFALVTIWVSSASAK